MSDNSVQIEINGVKMEVDTRYATRVEELKVGSRVKVLTKNYSGYNLSHGVIIGFEPFKELPTIIIAHMEIGYSKADLNILYYNAETKDIEVCAAYDDDEVALDKNAALMWFDKEIEKKKSEIQDLENKRDYFLDKFKTYWIEKEEA